MLSPYSCNYQLQPCNFDFITIKLEGDRQIFFELSEEEINHLPWDINILQCVMVEVKS